jgi:galactokinase
VATDPTDTFPGLCEQFRQKFGTQPRIFQAPGRVNLIGEHTDYNDGFVLPAAIQFQTTVAVAPRSDDKLVVSSYNYKEDAEFSFGHLPATARKHWSDYVVGVAKQLQGQSTPLRGANMLINGDVPQGAGLSSSASIEVVVCTALLDTARASMDGKQIALLCQCAENEFVGARCGIMDQFVSVHAKRDHALLLDCRTLEYQLQPLPTEVRLVVCNTMVRHSVAAGEYNQRRAECEEVTRFFASKKPGVKALRDVSLTDFKVYEAELPETLRRRCRHIIMENARVLEAGEALKHRNLERFGQLMGESHASLRDDFQVSCHELDVMVELAAGIKGVYGARMTGGGFGGCTINLVGHEHVEAFRAAISDGYERAIGKRPEVYVCTAGDGARRVA